MDGKKYPVIDKERCAGCSVCVESCPMDCLVIEEPKFRGDTDTAAQLKTPDACIGCGICERVCPVGAVRLGKMQQRVQKPDTGRGKRMLRYYCRAYQGVMKIAMYILPWRIPKILEGAGAVEKLPACIKKKHFKRVLIVTDKMLMEANLLDDLLAAMERERLDYTVFDGVKPNPTDLIIEEGVTVYHEHDCDCMIAFGGGSPMDCAKAIGARIARPHRSVKGLQGLFKVLKPIPALFAVPTTAGTGSETTIAAVVTISSTSHKASMTDLVLMPRYAVLDPRLTVALPKHVTAATGMDALCHAVEAYTNYTYNTRLENDLARKAVKLIYDNLLTAYEDGTNLKARQNMQRAAFYAGRAFTRGSVGYVHAVGHTLSGLYGVPHGLVMAILLPHVMRAFGPAVHERLAELSDVCGIQAKDASVKGRAEAFLAWMESMKRRMEIPEYPGMIRAEDVDRIVEWAYREGNPLYPVPVVWSKKDFKRFVREMMRDERDNRPWTVQKN